jgi:hypothetical protein
MSTKKSDPKFTIATISACGGGPLQIFLPSMALSLTILPNVRAKILWRFFSGAQA